MFQHISCCNSTRIVFCSATLSSIKFFLWHKTPSPQKTLAFYSTQDVSRAAHYRHCYDSKCEPHVPMSHGQLGSCCQDAWLQPACETSSDATTCASLHARRPHLALLLGQRYWKLLLDSIPRLPANSFPCFVLELPAPRYCTLSPLVLPRRKPVWAFRGNGGELAKSP